jgi:hypothetical protein
MAKASRRLSKTKPGEPPPPAARPSHVAPIAAPGVRRSPADELEARLAEPEEGLLLHALEERVACPGLLQAITDVGQRILELLGKHDATALLREYESLEFDITEVRERAAFGLGYEHGAADGRARLSVP